MQPLTPATRTDAAPNETELFNDVIKPLLGTGFGLALAMLNDRAAAEDAVQEAAIKACKTPVRQSLLAGHPGRGSGGVRAPAKLTLYTPRLSIGPGAGQGTADGSWVLQFTVTSQGGHALPTPTPGQAGNMAVTFDSVHAVPGALAIAVTTSGPSLRSWWAACPYIRGGGGQMDINGCAVDVVTVYDADGNAMKLVGGFEGQAEIQNERPVLTVIRWTGLVEAPRPGRYRIVVSTPDRLTLVRTVQVP